MHEHDPSRGLRANLVYELRHHIPFTIFGALTGVVIAIFFLWQHVPHHVSEVLFATLHPAHVFFSAVATTALFRHYTRRNWLVTAIVGYTGAIAIGTLSDSLMPYLSEWLLSLHARHMHGHVHAHVGFIDYWYIVNPLALLGVVVGFIRPRSLIPHAGHVLLSTWASLFHVLMAVTASGEPVSFLTMALIPVVLFFAVWVPCCTSDIVYPLVLAPVAKKIPAEYTDKDHSE
jgi:hypothetical protein